MAAQVPNIFVEQYDQGQKKIRADLMDENFAYVCTQLDANADTGSAAQAAADAAQATADAAQATADGKANADLDDVTAAGKVVMAHAAMPSGQTISMTVPANGGTVVAPDDGWMMFSASTPSGVVGQRLAISSSGVGSWVIIPSGSSGNAVYIPVKSGADVSVSYGNTTNRALVFVYANGSAPTN